MKKILLENQLSRKSIDSVPFKSLCMNNSTAFNPNAPVYVPRGLVFPGTKSSGMVSTRTKAVVPTAKVPNYVMRLGAGVRDTKPGLLPTPAIPPMTASGASMSFGASLGGTTYYARPLGQTEDAYATPYANKPRHTVPKVADSVGGASSESAHPPGFDSAPPGFHAVDKSTGSNDLVESLLSLLAQQLASPVDKMKSLPMDYASTAVSSQTGTGGTSTPLACFDYSKSGEIGMIPADRIETTDCEENLLEAIAGYYLPSGMN